MRQPDNADWEDIVASGTDAQAGPENAGWEKAGAQKVGPFAVAQPVDGYAFTLDPESPELRYQRQPQATTPAPPRREPPRRIGDQMPGRGVWQPGGSARTEQLRVRTPRPNLVKAVLAGLVPLALLGGGIYLVMRLYGF